MLSVAGNCRSSSTLNSKSLNPAKPHPTAKCLSATNRILKPAKALELQTMAGRSEVPDQSGADPSAEIDVLPVFIQCEPLLMACWILEGCVLWTPHFAYGISWVYKDSRSEVHTRGAWYGP